MKERSSINSAATSRYSIPESNRSEALTGVPVPERCRGWRSIWRMKISVALQGKYLSTGEALRSAIAVGSFPIPQTSPISTRWRRSRVSAYASGETPAGAGAGRSWLSCLAVKIRWAICSGCTTVGWRRGLRCASAGIPLLGSGGGYQMLGGTIVDEVESGLGTARLGLLNTVTQFARHKTTTLVEATMANALPDWLAGASHSAGARLRNSYGKRLLTGAVVRDTLEKQGIGGGWRNDG